MPDLDSISLNVKQQVALDTCKYFLSDPRAKTMSLSGIAGCVDLHTEFLTPTGWKKISQYTEGDLVCQWSQDGTTQFVKPLDYVVAPASDFNVIATGTVDMRVSDNHRMPYITSKGYPGVRPYSELASFYAYKIPRAFTSEGGGGTGLSAQQLRVLIMQAANGYVSPRAGVPNKMHINVRKQRKKQRVEALLNAAGIPFVIHKSQADYRNFFYTPPEPINTKDLSILWRASRAEMDIIYEELFHWAGSIRIRKGKEIRTFVGNAATVDLYQYVCSIVTGNYCSVTPVANPIGKEPQYLLFISTRSNSYINQHKFSACKVPSEDGKQYCFTTPSSFWLARRNGKIFPTGNSGKSMVVAFIEQYCLQNNLKVKFTGTTNAAAASLSKYLASTVTTVHKAFRIRVAYHQGQTKLVMDDYSSDPLKGFSLLVIDEFTYLSNELMALVRRVYKGKILFVGSRNQLLSVDDPYEGCVDSNYNCVLDQVERTTNVAAKTIYEEMDLAVEEGRRFRFQNFHPLVTSQAPTSPLKIIRNEAEQVKITHKLFHPDNPETSVVACYTNDTVIAANEYIAAFRNEELLWKPGNTLINNSLLMPVHTSPSVGQIGINNNQVITFPDKCYPTILNIYRNPQSKRNHEIPVDVLELIRFDYDGATYLMAQDSLHLKRVLNNLRSLKHWEQFYYVKDYIGDLRHSYARTIHKLQGDTFDNVIVMYRDVTTCQDPDTLRRLQNVGLSRFRKEVYIYE